MDEHCRITVVGDRRRVDLAVPAAAPIVTYVDTLARLCEQQSSDVLPSAWTLGDATGEPYAPEWALAELGIADGQVLYLRDLVGSEFTEPVVQDVAEQVEEAAALGPLGRRWDATARSVTVLVCAVGWLVAGLLTMAARGQLGRPVLIELTLACALPLPALAWTAHERGWRMPGAMRVVLALSAVPLLALCGALVASGMGAGSSRDLGGQLTAADLRVAGAAIGTLLGALVAFAAVPSTVTATALFAALVAGLLGAGLAAGNADGVQAAALAAVVCFAVLTFAPRIASGIVVFSARRVAMRTVAAQDTGDLVTAVGSATAVLVLWSAGLCLALAVSLAVAAASTSPYANAEAGMLGLALLLRAGTSVLAAEVVPLVLAGLTPLLTLLVVGPEHFGWGSWVAPAYTLAVGGLLLLYGFRRFMRRTGLPSLDRPRWLTPLGSWLAGGSAGFAVAALGAFGGLVALGRHL